MLLLGDIFIINSYIEGLKQNKYQSNCLLSLLFDMIWIYIMVLVKCMLNSKFLLDCGELIIAVSLMQLRV